MAAGREERWRSDKREEMRGMREQKQKRGDKVIEFLSAAVHPLPCMALPRTEIRLVLKALYHLVQTLNINQYCSYFIFSFVPWAASFNKVVMWPTGTLADSFS